MLFVVITYIKLYGHQKSVKFFVVSKKKVIMKIRNMLLHVVLLVSRGQTAFFRFYLWWQKKHAITNINEKSNMATWDYSLAYTDLTHQLLINCFDYKHQLACVTTQRKLLVYFKLSNWLTRQHAVNSNNMLLTESGFKKVLYMLLTVGMCLITICA